MGFWLVVFLLAFLYYTPAYILPFLALLALLYAPMATRYLLVGDSSEGLAPIAYVIGMVLAPFVVTIALVKWLFTAKI